MSIENENKISALARLCIKEHKANKKKMTSAQLKSMIAPYREQAKALGCDELRFTYEMGLINGVLKEKG